MPSKKYYKQLKKECQSCKSKLNIWVDNMDFEGDKEEAMKKHANNYCSTCAVFQDIKKKNEK